LKICLKILY